MTAAGRRRRRELTLAAIIKLMNRHQPQMVVVDQFDLLPESANGRLDLALLRLRDAAGATRSAVIATARFPCAPARTPGRRVAYQAGYEKAANYVAQVWRPEHRDALNFALDEWEQPKRLRVDGKSAQVVSAETLQAP